MEYGLPIPTVKAIPIINQENPDAGWVALTNKLDTILEYLSGDARGLKDLTSIEKCPAALVDDMGNKLAAGIVAGDTDRVKRQKIYTAIEGHKARGRWTADVKPKIDFITGASASLYVMVDDDDEIICGDGITETLYGSDYWGTIGCDGIDTHLGSAILTDGTEPEISGNIYIDLGSSTVTTAQILALVDLLKTDIVPAYEVIYLGYSTAGVWTQYTGGII